MALYRRGNTWWIDFTAANGVRIRQSACTDDRAKAQQLFDKLKFESWQQVQLGMKPRRTWDEAALKWLKEKSDKKSIRGDVGIIKWLTPFFRGKFLDELTRSVIMELIEKKKAESSPSRANRYLALIRSILTRAVRIWEWLDKAPALTLYREPRLRVRYLTVTEIRRLLDALPEHQKDIFMFSIMTGFRKSNVLNLRWNQVDFYHNLIVIDGDEMKAGKTHAYPISPSIRQLLERNMGKHPEYVFTYNGHKVVELKKDWSLALKKAGITNYRWHDNRHTWASLLIQNGVPMHEVQEMGGWSSELMVKRYAHLAPSKLANNAAMLDTILTRSVTFNVTNLTH